MHKKQVATLLGDVSPNSKLRILGRDSLAETHVHLNSEAIGVHLASDNPATSFVDECAQDATVQGVDPSLIIGLWLPVGDNVVAVFPKL